MYHEYHNAVTYSKGFHDWQYQRLFVSRQRYHKQICQSQALFLFFLLSQWGHGLSSDFFWIHIDICRGNQISQENYKFFHGQSFQVMYYLLFIIISLISHDENLIVGHIIIVSSGVGSPLPVGENFDSPPQFSPPWVFKN